jgi:hypothetical protein
VAFATKVYPNVLLKNTTITSSLSPAHSERGHRGFACASARILGPAVIDCDALALDLAGILEASAKAAQTLRQRVRRLAVEEPNHRHRWLLRPRRDRPRSRRTAEQRDEFAPSKLIKLHPLPLARVAA